MRPAIFVLAAVVLSCSAEPPRAPDRPGPVTGPARRNPIAYLEPARYVVPDLYRWIERTAEGVDHVVVGRRRAELRGSEILWMGPARPAVDAGMAVPPWAIGGSDSLRVVFWAGKQVYAADSFRGELKPIGTLPGEVMAAFDGLDGVVMLTPAGPFVVRNGALLEPPAMVPKGVVDGVASGPKVAVWLTVFGHAWLTLDGGRSYRDVSAQVSGAVGLRANQDQIAVGMRDGSEQLLGPVRKVDAVIGTEMRRSGSTSTPPPDFDNRWPAGSGSALDAVVSSAVVLPDGGVLASGDGFVGRVDLASGRGQSGVQWPEAAGLCELLQAPDTILLLCAGPERATVMELGESNQIERTFNLANAPEYDRFSAVDGEALGFVGPCDGSPPPVAPADGISPDSVYNPSSQRSPVFCSRAGRDAWVEHRLDPADAMDVFAWVPRPGGGAVALIARPGFFIQDERRVEDRGLLRMVRVARNEPPLSIPSYAERPAVTVSRALAVTPEGELQGWLPSDFHPSSLIAVRIDAAGQVRQAMAPPRLLGIATSGPLALALSQDDRFFQTTDFGQRWIEVEPPPDPAMQAPSSCTAAGCRVGPFIRIGWGAPDPVQHGTQARSAGTNGAASSPPDIRTTSDGVQDDSPPEADRPLVRLACHSLAPPEGSRLADSFGFGVTPAPVPRMTTIRMGALGTLLAPSHTRLLATAGDVEIGWLPPLDPRAPIRRATLPLSRMPSVGGRIYEARIGYLIDAKGRVRPINTGHPDRCPAPLLDEAGVTQSIGGCARDPSAGVLLDDRIVLLHHGGDEAVVSAGDLPAVPAVPIALRELARTALSPNARRFTFGAGLRKGMPVAVAVDAAGHANLSPIDPERGTLGPEEALAPLVDMIPATDPRCTQIEGARVIVPLTTEIGLARGPLPGVFSSGTFALAVIRWAREAACVEAVELSVRDERHENEVTAYEGWGTLRKVIARFDGERPGNPAQDANASLVVIGPGAEIRQRLRCERITQ
jgi:hypothetical protein